MPGAEIIGGASAWILYDDSDGGPANGAVKEFRLKAAGVTGFDTADYYRIYNSVEGNIGWSSGHWAPEVYSNGWTWGIFDPDGTVYRWSSHTHSLEVSGPSGATNEAIQITTSCTTISCVSWCCE